MSVKQVVVIIILAIITGIGVNYGIQKVISSTQSPTQIPTPTSIPTPTPITLTSWNDPAGFSFQYPSSIAINKHPEDTTNYANLTLTDADQPGNITIIMADDKFKTLDKWVASSPDLQAGNSLDTLLDSKVGKKVLTASTTIIGVIDSGVIVTLQRDNTISPLLDTTWQKILDTWTFIYPTPTPGKSSKTAVPNDSGDVLQSE